MAKADLQSKQAADGEDAESASSSQQRLIDKDAEMNVEEWEFVSEHALAAEYIANAANTVSTRHFLRANQCMTCSDDDIHPRMSLV